MVLQNNSPCPVCSGSLRINFNLSLQCVDCRAVFEPIGMGIADKELDYRRVKIDREFSCSGSR